MSTKTHSHITSDTTRRGKIARLPVDIRNELNQRLEAGQSAATILPWLNELPPVQELLQQNFAGEPVSAQNLSAWRSGGFRDWRHWQEARHLALQIDEQQEELEADGRKRPLIDCLAAALGLQLAMALRSLQDEDLKGKEHWERLHPLLHELERLRRGEHRAMQLRINRERWAAEQDIRQKKEHAELLEKERQRKIKAMQAPDFLELAAKSRGGGIEQLRECALHMELIHDLAPGTLSRKYEEQAAREKAAAELRAREEKEANARRMAYWDNQRELRKARALAKKQAAAASAATEPNPGAQNTPTVLAEASSSARPAPQSSNASKPNEPITNNYPSTPCEPHDSLKPAPANEAQSRSIKVDGVDKNDRTSNGA